MKSKIFWMLISGVLILSCGSLQAYAQEQTDVAEELPVPAVPAEDLTNYSYGTVVRASAQEIVLSEYDLATDGDVEVTYKIDPNVEMENIKAIEEVQPGDNVDLDYVEKDGVKTAVYIAREVLGEEG